MKYILLNGNKVQEIIPGENPIFPGIPIEARYAPDFVAKLIPVEDDVEVEQNWVYEDGKFMPPPIQEPVLATQEPPEEPQDGGVVSEDAEAEEEVREDD